MGKYLSFIITKEIYLRELRILFLATRYHSLIIEKKSLPKNLVITAYTKNGIIMGIKDRNFPLYGVQFHPESIFNY